MNVNNTNTSFGLHDGDRWVAHWRVATDRAKQPDEYAMLLRSLFDYAGLDWAQVAGLALASVVPPITAGFVDLSRRCLKHDPLIVTHQIRTGVKILIDYPAEIGADRILNGLGARTMHGAPCVVVDFGTATTFDAISPEGDYVGGAIAPGLGIAAEALFSRTAKLPRIELIAPPAAIGRNTVHAMQSGLVLGYVGLIAGLVGRIRSELGGRAKVIATGGMAHIEGITKEYGAAIIVGETTRELTAHDFIFRELDRVRVKGKLEPVAIYKPIGLAGEVDKRTLDELKLFNQAIRLYRAQEWDTAELQLINLLQLSPDSRIYQTYLERVGIYRTHPPARNWDGAFTFDHK